MLEPDEVRRWERNARALGRKADDAEGLAQVLGLAQMFEDEAMRALDRLLADGYSYGYLASGVGVSRQALQQRHARFLTRTADPGGGGVRADRASSAKDAPMGGPAGPPGFLAPPSPACAATGVMSG